MTMFKKAFKYDFGYVYRFWWIIVASVLGLSLLGSMAFRFVATFETRTASTLGMFLYTMANIFMFASFFAIAMSFLVPQILCYVRFYKNFFTDEGYLTFTLPVSRRTLFLSKTVNAVLWTVLHGLLLVVAGAIIITVAPVPNRGELLTFILWEDVGEIFSYLWKSLGGWLLVYILEGILMAIAAGWFTCALVQFCITIGAVVAKKHKVLAAFGIYYGVNTATTFALQFVIGLGLIFVVVPMFALLELATFAVTCTSVALLLLIVLMGEIAVACLFHFLALGTLERKLNLS
ncbi:MAG: hypothetical protein IKV50_04775 [Clostridia bacterium]|nr:hypothetical protein [Clostridia bacterium]MBR6553835.1 hypothetical protein [Clostridia bacterium]